MHRQYQPSLDDLCEAGTLLIVQSRCAPKRSAGRETIVPIRIEVQGPVLCDLLRDPAKLGGIAPVPTINDQRYGQKPRSLIRV